MSKDIPNEFEHLVLDRFGQVVDYLYRTEKFLLERHENLDSWKWVVIALHGAIYDLAITACRGLHPSNIWMKRKESKQSEEPRLISFPEAIRRCRLPENAKNVQADSHLILTKEEDGALGFLKNWLRNNLEHFVYDGWTIEVSGMPVVVNHCLTICEKLALEVIPEYSITEEQRKQLLERIQLCRAAI